ncbi:hypothetical protein EB03_00719 [Enterococcus hirae]|uniref:Uncharacterized protein n=1 Tax=Enterococcus hirae TaxID=1354 RepID=A0AB37ICE0_ENTHR|nr:hypothetical protein EB03_00719 [Enterococcus hirae]
MAFYLLHNYMDFIDIKTRNFLHTNNLQLLLYFIKVIYKFIHCSFVQVDRILQINQLDKLL